MKVAIIGTRGIPANYGGFETFAEELVEKLEKKDNIELMVICDSDHNKKVKGKRSFGQVKLEYSHYSKTKKPLRYYLDSIKIAIKNDYDVILSCGLGGGFWACIPMMKGKIFVTNPDGLEWKRSKFSFPKRILLKLLEKCSVRFSKALICDSYGITKYMQDTYRSKGRIFTIEYGAYINKFIKQKNQKVTGILKKYKLEADKYHLVVGRFEPENNIKEIAEGFLQSKSNYPLVVVTNKLDNAYVNEVKKIVDNSSNRTRIIWGIYDKEELACVRANARSYIHGHSVGGTNPSLLEAMGSRNLCICHDNIFNREVIKDKNGYFFKNADDLAKIVDGIDYEPLDILELKKDNVLKRIGSYYNWEMIAERYCKTFRELYDENIDN